MDEQECPLCGYEEALEARHKRPGDAGDRFGCRECGGEFVVDADGDITFG